MTAEQWWKKFSDARIAIAVELGLEEQLPYPLISPSSQPRGFRDLLARRREEGSNADRVTLLVFERSVARAREENSVHWLGDRLFSEGAWRDVRDSSPEWRRVPRATQKSSGALQAADDFIAAARAAEQEAS